MGISMQEEIKTGFLFNDSTIPANKELISTYFKKMINLEEGIGYKEIGMQDVKLRLYENDRHEILNELDREIVFVDICKWLEKRR